MYCVASRKKKTVPTCRLFVVLYNVAGAHKLEKTVVNGSSECSARVPYTFRTFSMLTTR